MLVTVSRLLNAQEASEASEASEPLFAHRSVPTAIVDWFEHAGATLKARNAPADQIAIYVSAMGEVTAYARERYTEAELNAARARGPNPLPEPEWCPDLSAFDQSGKPRAPGNDWQFSSAVQMLKAA